MMASAVLEDRLLPFAAGVPASGFLSFSFSCRGGSCLGVAMALASFTGALATFHGGYFLGCILDWWLSPGAFRGCRPFQPGSRPGSGSLLPWFSRWFPPWFRITPALVLSMALAFGFRFPT
ncbi:hypothetical protein QBC33DRAFT_552843 [Phialemonium atrogriseum]|uniref:Uncharacterized protein n=1 Tax=Phialemonium atrogriseum TaxID=1093897 RepID=A0AAJ0BQA5_9PEZI|nr:uncharacterized protein QBC33DRAFT_552843 [Phialemonium atrogriseum]KAK1762107.1 hypothetical protein QBC33DRAFT_552843 [Phialemonium atrogriseum]